MVECPVDPTNSSRLVFRGDLIQAVEDRKDMTAVNQGGSQGLFTARALNLRVKRWMVLDELTRHPVPHRDLLRQVPRRQAEDHRHWGYVEHRAGFPRDSGNTGDRKYVQRSR